MKKTGERKRKTMEATALTITMAKVSPNKRGKEATTIFQEKKQGKAKRDNQYK